MDMRTEERYEDDFNQGNLFIMKRSGERVPFDASKIVKAIEKANAEVTIPLEKMSEERLKKLQHRLSVMQKMQEETCQLKKFRIRLKMQS